MPPTSRSAASSSSPNVLSLVRLASVSAVASRETALRLALLFSPTIILVVLLRLFEYSFLSRPGSPPVSLIATTAALTPVSLAVLVLLVFAWMRMRRPAVPVSRHALASALLLVALLIVTAFTAPPWTTEWLSRPAFEAVRLDLSILLLLLATFLILLERTRSVARVVSLVLLHVLIPLLVLIPAVSFGYTLSTGSPLDGALLKHFLLHGTDFAAIVASEVHGLNVLLLFLPAVVTLAPFVVLAVPAVRRWAAAVPATEKIPWGTLGCTAPLVLLLVLPPRTPLPPSIPATSYSGLMRSLATSAPATPLPAGLLHDAPPPFDTHALRLLATDSTRRLNVVFVVLESTRARSTTPYNPEIATTPFLDSLAQHALLVEQMYSVVPYTNKSMAPIFGGIYAYPHRRMVEALPDAVPGRGLPALLRPHGYRSAFFTPARLDFENKDLILRNLGFEDVRGHGDYPTEDFEEINYFGFEDRIVLPPSMAWVDERRAAGEPFFLAYLTLAAHHPYAIPSSFDRVAFSEEEPLNSYLNALHYTDAFLRDLFAAFESRGLLDETLFVITGDHGQAFGEHGQRMHANVLWDEALEVPALLYNPVLFPDGGRIAGPRQHIDLLPTVADALGLRPADGRWPGSSLLHPESPDRRLFFNAWESDEAIALRQDSLKFIYYYRRRPMQAFNLSADPFERRDIAAHLSETTRREAELHLLLWRKGVLEGYE